MDRVLVICSLMFITLGSVLMLKNNYPKYDREYTPVREYALVPKVYEQVNIKKFYRKK